MTLRPLSDPLSSVVTVKSFSCNGIDILRVLGAVRDRLVLLLGPKGGPERPLKWQFDQRTLTCKTPKFGRRDQGVQRRSPEEHARRRARSRLRARHAASEDFTRSARRAGDDADKGANQNRSL